VGALVTRVFRIRRKKHAPHIKIEYISSHNKVNSIIIVDYCQSAANHLAHWGHQTSVPSVHHSYVPRTCLPSSLSLYLSPSLSLSLKHSLASRGRSVVTNRLWFVNHHPPSCLTNALTSSPLRTDGRRLCALASNHPGGSSHEVSPVVL
jgi:hypothetical protein